MKRLFPVFFAVSSLLLAHSFAGSATWSANPVSGDWNNPLNWTPNNVPNGPGDTATFGISSVTSVSLSSPIEVEGIVFNAGANTFTIASPVQFTLSGSGVTNNSGVTQTFLPVKRFVPILFTNSATAGSGTLFTNHNGDIEFRNNASAGSATFVTSGIGEGKGITIFFDDATCENATFISQDGGRTYPRHGANATFVNNAGGFTLLGTDGDQAENATLIANSGGEIDFDYFSRGDTARVELFGSGYLDLASTDLITIGSIEGDGGTVELADTQLKVGANHLNTVFGGLIIDQFSEIFGGTLIKVGTGTLKLTSANTYRNGTVVSNGALIVANTIGSATGPDTVTVEEGTLGGKGIIAGETTIGTASGPGAFLQPGKGASTPTTLTFQSYLTLKADATYIWKLNTKKAKADQVVTNGISIEPGAEFDLNTVANKKLTPGKVFTAINNTAATSISGTFANLADGSTVTAGVNKLLVSYSGGDGNDLTLTVVP